jgi:hypothetical protein
VGWEATGYSFSEVTHGSKREREARDTEKGTLVGISIWESQEAFQAAALTLQHAFPSDEWEVKPREISMLNSAV